MSMDHNNTSMNRGSSGADGGSVTDSELMTAVPIWEQRGKKRRGLGARRASSDMAPTSSTTAAAEPRSFGHDDMDRGAMGAAGTMGAAGGAIAASEPVRRDQPHLPIGDVREPEYVHASAPEAHAMGEDPVLMAGPIGRTHTTTSKRRSGPAPAALALGLVAVAGLGAAGWYATQNGDDGVPELTAGQPMATAPLASDVASNGTLVGTPTTTAPAAAPPAAPMATARVEIPRTAPVRTASRTRPAAAPSAGESGVNASASVGIPSAPQPYMGAATSPTTSSTAATTVNPTPAAPPAAIPQTPPIDAAPAPVAADPVTPEPAPADTTETPAP